MPFLIVPEADAASNDFSNAIYDADGSVTGLVNGTGYVVYALSDPSGVVTPVAVGGSVRPVVLNIAGQSNATASATAGKDVSRYSVLSNVFIVQNDGAVEAYQPGVNSYPDGGANPTDWGTEAEFALRHVTDNPGVPIIIVKEAAPGNEIGLDANGDWNAANPSGRRVELIEKRQFAADWIQAQGWTEWNEYLAWNQGEADAGLQLTAEQYSTQLGLLMADLRAQTYTPTGGSNGPLFHADMTIVMERLRPQANGTSDNPYYAGLIRHGQYLFKEAELVAGRNAAMIDLDQFPQDFRRVHPALDPQDGATWMYFRGAELYDTVNGNRYDPDWALRPEPHNREYAVVETQVPPQFTIPDLTDQVAGARVSSGWIKAENDQRAMEFTVTGGGNPTIALRYRNQQNGVSPNDLILTDNYPTAISSGLIYPWTEFEVSVDADAAAGGSRAVVVSVGPSGQEVTETWNVGTAGAGGGDVAPVNTVAPAITGTFTEGQTLSVSDGTWTGTPTPTFSYQWTRGGVDISGATANTYTLVSADVGTVVDCNVTGTNTEGSATASATGEDTVVAAGGGGNEAETTAFIATSTGAGGTAFTTPQETALNDFFVTAKASTWWAKLGTLRSRFQDETTSQLDLKDQTTFATAFVGEGDILPWTQEFGWSGTDNNQSLDLNINPQTISSQDSASLLLWYSRLASGTQGEFVGSSGATADLFVRFPDTGAGRVRLNSASNNNMSGLETTVGLRAAVRSSSAGFDLIQPSGAVLNRTAASTTPTSTTMFLGTANGTGTTSDAGIYVVGFGSALTTTEVGEIRTALTTLLAAFAA